MGYIYPMIKAIVLHLARQHFLLHSFSNTGPHHRHTPIFGFIYNMSKGPLLPTNVPTMKPATASKSRRVRNKKACCRTAIDHLLQPSHLEESPNLILLLLQHSPQGFKLEILADVPRRCLDTSERLDLYQCRRSWTSGNTSSLPLDTVGTRSAPRS